MRGCESLVRRDYFGALCSSHERVKRIYGKPKAVPLEAPEFHLWRMRARRLLTELRNEPAVLEALRVCSAVLAHGPSIFKQRSLRRALENLSLSPATLLQVAVGLELRCRSPFYSQLPVEQQWLEVVRWTLRMGKAGRRGAVLGSNARRELAGVLQGRLGGFVSRCAERWEQGGAVEREPELPEPGAL